MSVSASQVVQAELAEPGPVLSECAARRLPDAWHLQACPVPVAVAVAEIEGLVDTGIDLVAARMVDRLPQASAPRYCVRSYRGSLVHVADGLVVLVAEGKMEYLCYSCCSRLEWVFETAVH